MPVEVAIDLTYALYAMLFTGAAFDWTTLVDPWGLWTSPGRPRDQATEQVITRLSHSTNPAARLWAVELDKGLVNFGIPISTSGSGRTILNAWFSQFVDNLVAQGVDKVRAQEIGVHAMSRAAQAGSPLEPELREPLAAGLTFNGPQSIADQFLKGIDYWKKQGLVGQQLLTHAENWTLNHSTAAELTQLKIGQPSSTQPVLPVLPTTPGTCQPGYTYDPATQLCWPTPPPPQPIQGLCPPGQHWDPIQLKCVPDVITPAPGPNPSSDNDELGDYGDAILAELQTIAANLGNNTGGTNEECCQNVVSGIAGITGALTAILSALPAGGGGNVVNIDLAPVVDAIGQLVAAVQNVSSSSGSGAPVDLTETNAQLANIANAISAPGADTTPIVDALNKANELQDVPTALLQQLAADDFIPPSYAQFFQGSPASWMKTIDDTVSRTLNSIHWKKDLDVHLRRLADIYNFRPTKTTEEYWKMPPLTKDEVNKAVASEIQGPVVAAFDVSGALFEPIITALLNVHGKTLEKLTNVKPGDEENAATTLLGEAVGAGVGAHLAAVAGEALYPSKNLGLGQVAALMSELAGFAEIMKGIIGPEVTQAIAIPHRYKINSQARAVLPQLMQAQILLGRRKISAAQFAELAGFNGLSRDYEAAVQAASFRPVQPRALATALQDAPFPADDIRRVLEDNGYSDADVQLMLDLFEYQSTRNLRQSYVAEAMSAYGQGVISDDELNSVFQDVGWSTEAQSLARKRALLLRRIGLARDAEATILPEIRAGVLALETGIEQLESAGLQTWKAETQATKANAGAIVRRYNKTLSDAEKAETQRRRNLKNAAIAEFQRGFFDEAGLTGALLSIPLDPLEAASIVAVQNATRAGRQKYLYGQLRTPQQAETLRIQVEAIGDQYKKELTTAATARQQLAALQVDDKDIQALLAKWGALRGKPSTTAVFNPT